MPRETAALQQLMARRLTGTPDQVRNAVARYQATGQLAELTAPRPVPGRPGLITVDVRVLRVLTDEPIPAAAPAAPARRRRRWPYVLAAVIAALGLLAWALYAAVTAIAAAVASAGPGLIGLVIIGLLLAAAGGTKACTTVISITHKH